MRSRFTCVGLMVVLILLLIPISKGQATNNIAVIYTDSTNNTLRTMSGLIWYLDNSTSDWQVSKHLLKQNEKVIQEQMLSLDPVLLITIGTTATEFAKIHFPQSPIVFAKVLNPIESGFIESWEHPGGHITGSSLDIPVLLQMEKFANIISGLEKIGVVYTENTSRLVVEAQQAAAKLGITLIPYKLSSAKELPSALDSLCSTVDGIWTVADEELSSPQFIRYTLLEALRSNIPVMGFSRSFVESGALFCLEADYKYIGRQAAKIALQVLDGADPAELSPTVPDIVYLYLNLKTEKRLNLTVPPELVDIAKETY